MIYFLHVLIFIEIYLILSLSFNLMIGYLGVLSIAHAAFYGIGAYVAALMAIKLGSPFGLNVICAMIVCGISGVVVGIPSLRIKDDYFVIVTFAFQVVVFSILNNWISFTGGPMGLPGIPQPVIGGWRIDSHIDFVLLAGVFFLFTLWIYTRIVKSPIGRILKAIRENEVFVAAMGKNIFYYKVSIFVIGASLAGLSGVVYAHYVTFIDPSSFTVMESVFIISIVILGGAGSLWGPVIGSIVLVTMPEALRFIGMPSSVAANVRQILYGALLVICMMWRPQGFIGEYAFRKET